MGWVKGSDRNFKASQTERYRKTKKDRRERRETSGGGPKVRVRGRGSSTCAPGSGPRIALAKNMRGQGSRLSTGQAEGGPHAPEKKSIPFSIFARHPCAGAMLICLGSCWRKPAEFVNFPHPPEAMAAATTRPDRRAAIAVCLVAVTADYVRVPPARTAQAKCGCKVPH